MEIREDVHFFLGTASDHIARGVGSCNCIVIGHESFLLIDPGESVSKVVHGLTGRIENDHLDLKNLSKILFTHVHFDHANAAATFQKLHNCEAWVHPLDRRAIEEPNFEYERIYNPLKQYKEFGPIPTAFTTFLLGIFLGKRNPVEVTGTITNGQEFPVDGFSVRAIYTPGHSPGHTSFYIPKLKTLIAGDVIDREMDQRPFTGTCMNNMESCYEDLISSLKMLRDLDIELYIPGHGPVIEGKQEVTDFVERNYQMALHKPTQLLEILGQKTLSLKNLYKLLYPNISFSLSNLKKIETLLLVQYLEQQNKVARTVTGNIQSWTATGVNN
jgi:glyoxylase-like metal-dependent hydrolase (beta-lactamase superfamily II)